MPRSARLDSPGTLHHVMVRGIERRAIVEDDADRTKFVKRMGRLSKDLQTPVYAWALMTNHAHILLRSGLAGISTFMRKLLTGYAGGYNRRHRRHGHLFQNRFKSIVVEEDTYFKELVRYIHLNPVRAGMVDSINKLNYCRWAGHSAIVGRRTYDWQETDYVLKWFGDEQKQARQSYLQFIKQGLLLGRQPHLVGGGLIRSAGGWSEVKALRRVGMRENYDERILGSGAFVTHVLKEAKLEEKYRIANLDREKLGATAVEDYCQKAGIHVQALVGGSRRRHVSKARRDLACKLTDEFGFSLAETARFLGVSTSAVAKILMREQA